MTYYLTISTTEPYLPFEMVMELSVMIHDLKYTHPNIDIKLKINEAVEIKNKIEESEKPDKLDD